MTGHVLTQAQWRARQQVHWDRVDPWIVGRAARRAAGQRHPVDDFLFEYYPYSMAKLRRWHPGLGMGLLRDAQQFLELGHYRRDGEAVTVDADALPRHRARLELVNRILIGTAERAPMTNCFALHEWAMVYRAPELRHEQYPLRVSEQELEATISQVGLRCTHIDAYRFFTDAAVPLNALVPTRERQEELEPPGCLHASMDLYKYAMWLSPFIASELVADCFALARQGRALDMRASPYDLQELGVEPIQVQTSQGRALYAAEQQRFMASAAIVRGNIQRQIAELLAVLDAA